jgi:murein DD-endopeptidase MepM/ murein hydrolase activator NlpD
MIRTLAVDEWYEAAAVVAFRRGLMHDLLKARRAEADQIAQVDRLAGDKLRKLEDALTQPTLPAGYGKLWQMQARLGLPAPLEYLPVQSSDPADIETMSFSGFGPTTFAFENWAVYYENTRGLHNGVDYIVPAGSPLIAVADGEIVDFRFLANPNEKSLALRPYLPETYRKPDGSRVLSNLIIAYGHLTNDAPVALKPIGSVVQAGQVIGASGCPVYTRDDGSVGIQYNNAHLHLEAHLIANGPQHLGSHQPFNPMLFFAPRLIAWQARLATHGDQPPYPSGGQAWGRLGFFSLGGFRYEPSTIVWEYEPKRTALWPEGVYDLDQMILWLETFVPYPTNG